jgi:hypothetical protein
VGYSFRINGREVSAEQFRAADVTVGTLGVGDLTAMQNVKSRWDAKYPYVSSRLPRNLEGCRCTPEGKPIVESKSHEANILAEARGLGAHAYRE